MNELQINPEFQSLIPALIRNEFDLLEKSILKEGCRDPLITWNGILIDGHNRYEICQKHKIEFQTKGMKFENADAAKAWMIDNQLGRRNLKPDQFTLLLGQRYKLEKQSHGGDRKSENENEKSSGQNVHQQKTADEIGKQHGVSGRTVQRAEKVLDAVDALEKIEPGIKEKMMNGKAPAKSTIIEAAKVAESEPEKAKEILNAPRETKRPKYAQENGLEYGRLAVLQLEKISKTDKQRQVAFDYVIQWIEKNR